MNEEFEVLKIAVQRLNKAGIDYMVSGSVAANYYSVPRMTRDIDIVVEIKAEDVDKFVALFAKDFYFDEAAIRAEISRRGMFNLIHNQYVIKLDFIVRKDTDFQDSSFARRRRALVEDESLWFISPEDLVLAKLLWAKDSHSEIQLKDIKNLISMVNTLDLNYIDTWVSKLGLRQIYNEAKQ